ncbi:chemotaxis protein CheA [Zavarzinia sp. CC-PAN008]|uniref:chemotaxis protein CheA n=1 Tax=Zavarzinia sp. CC-PAN008 TaxID=3243332 RepID=UPI003F742CF3
MGSPDPAETFRQEAAELLEQIEQDLLDLEHDPANRELVDRAFRALHTLKGSGAMFGFEQVAEFTHDFETAFDQIRKGVVSASRDLVGVALAAKDHIRTLIQRPEDGDPAIGAAILGELHALIGRATPGSDMPAGTAGEPAEQPVTWRIAFRLAPNVLVNGTNPLLLLDELHGLGTCTLTPDISGIPALDGLEPDALHLAWSGLLTTTQGRDAIEDVFMFVRDDMDLVLEPLAETAADADATPAANAVAPAEGPAEAKAAEPRAPEARATEAKSGEAKSGEAKSGEAKSGGTLRVQAERLDELMDRVGELVIAQARLTQIAGATTDLNIKAVAEEIERLVSGLRDTTMGIRMVPIGSLFGRFRRLVHDLSRDLGKQVELVTIGEETELDKTMVERLADPLVHLIRNAIDHGLEDAATRATAGKSGGGRIRLIARYSGAEVLVTVADDGRGLNAARIRAKAEEAGLIAPGAKLSDAELYQFLFHPGFSTAKEISAISGRGVGMDVVKRTIEAMRGTIDMTTDPGRGTEVTLRLPLTLAIIDGLLVRVGAGRYAIPLSSVEECVELAAADDVAGRGSSFLNIREALVPFLRLREIFATGTPAEPHQKVVVVSSGDLRVGLVVDQIIGSHQTVIKSLSKLQADVETFSGATILGDGTVALILDVAHLVERGQAREERIAQAALDRAALETQP